MDISVRLYWSNHKIINDEILTIFMLINIHDIITMLIIEHGASSTDRGLFDIKC